MAVRVGDAVRDAAADPHWASCCGNCCCGKSFGEAAGAAAVGSCLILPFQDCCRLLEGSESPALVDFLEALLLLTGGFGRWFASRVASRPLGGFDTEAGGGAGEASADPAVPSLMVAPDAL